MVIVFQKHNLLSCHSVPNDVKSCFDFCNVWPKARITCSSSSIINHILASFPDRVTQKGTLNLKLSDHQLIYCKRKITRIKRGGHKQIKFHSFKNYSIDGYEKALVEIDFPEYRKFDNVNDAYSNFIQELTKVTDKVKISKKTRLHVDKEIYKRAQYRGFLIAKKKK